MNNGTLPDIRNREDVTTLVTEFYAKVRADENLAPLFTQVDWEHHIPVIIDFWCMILFGDRRYQGSPFSKHLSLPLQSHHFSQWLNLFRSTVDEYFSGLNATEAKTRAETIARLFQHKLGLLS